MYGAVVSLNAANDYVVATASMKVDIFDKNNELLRSFTRFPGTAQCGTLRADGNLLAAGCSDGSVRVFDAKTRDILRIYKGHSGAVRGLAFCHDHVTVVTCGDDGTVRLWDLATRHGVGVLRGHTDHVRAVVCFESSPSFVASCSYDGSAIVWDITQKRSVFRVEHGAPVEALLVNRSGTLLVTAGGNAVKIWDCVENGKLVHEMKYHQKTITSLAMDASEKRLLSGGLEQIVQVCDMKTYTLLYTIHCSGPVLSLALTRADSLLVLGLSSGECVFKQRAAAASEEQRTKVRNLRPGTRLYMRRGMLARESPGDVIAQKEEHREVRLKKYDRLLKTFKYREALDAVLSEAETEPVTETKEMTVVAMLENLVLRDGLGIAIGGRDEETLLPLLRFCEKSCTVPERSAIVLAAIECVLDIYGSFIGASDDVDELFFRILSRMEEELQLEKELRSLQGMLKMVISMNERDIKLIQ